MIFQYSYYSQFRKKYLILYFMKITKFSFIMKYKTKPYQLTHRKNYLNTRKDNDKKGIIRT